jgi:multidrug efflux pump subunit AcrA (membrane-fusion protein)
MFVSGSIVTRAQPDVITVPVAAIRTRDDASFVMAVANGVVEERPVVTGASWDNAAAMEVLSGLKAGDVIVGTPLSGLDDGAAVMIEGN